MGNGVDGDLKKTMAIFLKLKRNRLILKQRNKEIEMAEKQIDLPEALVNAIRNGNVFLLIGSGASIESGAPSSGKLADSIVEKFLPQSYKGKPLAVVVEYAISQFDLLTVQKFVAEQLRGLRPSNAHEILTTFRWQGIATTNFDLLIEDAYCLNKKSVQDPVIFINDQDRIYEKLRNDRAMPLIKLHGCLTAASNPDLPMILSTEQYVNYSMGRKRLFNVFKDQAIEHTLLAIGYSLSDLNIRGIFSEIDSEIKSRPRYYMVLKDADDIVKTHWEEKRISVISATFGQFMESLDRAIGPHLRGLLAPSEFGNPDIQKRIRSGNHVFTLNTKSFIESDIDVVNSVTITESVKAGLFYRGVDVGWSGIDQGFDVKRKLMDQLLSDYALETPEDQISLVVIKGHAGAGKTILLRRLAWECAKNFDLLSLFVKSDGVINSSAIVELSEATKGIIFIFVDNVISRRNELTSLFGNKKSIAGKVVIFSTARTNEWNTAPQQLTSLATDQVDLPYLEESEIGGLLKLLEKHKELGSLERLNPEDRRKELAEKAGRQLLVALHEATHGKGFRDIVIDEYNKIYPEAARQIYLTVCFLNRFDVPVRAGYIRRLYGIPFEEFKREFFAPLEQVVFAKKDKIDVFYLARHPYIAEIVVAEILSRTEALFNETIRTVKLLNPSYSTDRIAVRKLANARTILEHFHDHDMAIQLFRAMYEAFGDDDFLLQQRAIYEMDRPNGNLSKAEEYLKKAISQNQRNHTLFHTLAELYVRRAERAQGDFEKRKFLSEARNLCRDSKSKGKGEPHPYYTLIKIGTMRLKIALSETPPNEKLIDDIAKETEDAIRLGRQLFPLNSFISVAEGKYAEAIVEDERVEEALERAFQLNQRNPALAMRLAKLYIGKNNVQKSIAIINQALSAKPSDRGLHFEYGRLLMDSGKGTPDEILYHFGASYSPGDSNYEAQYFHARQLFVVGKFRESQSLFSFLRTSGISPQIKFEARYPLPDSFQGIVSRLEATYCIIDRDNDQQRILAPASSFNLSQWPNLKIGMRLSFNIAFTMKGAVAVNVIQN